MLSPAIASDGERARDGAARRVLVRDRGTEERHHAVAARDVDDALAAVDARPNTNARYMLEEIMVLLGVEPLGERRRADQVAEQHRDLLALALDRPS